MPGLVERVVAEVKEDEKFGAGAYLHQTTYTATNNQQQSPIWGKPRLQPEPFSAAHYGCGPNTFRSNFKFDLSDLSK
jgi:hypothetical protein